MAFKEIFELGSLLHGDDQEKSELERQISSLTSSIKQQEGRCLHEMGELRRLEEEIERSEINFDSASTTLTYLEAKINNLENEARALSDTELIHRFQVYMNDKFSFIEDIKVVEEKLKGLELEISQARNISTAQFPEASEKIFVETEVKLHETTSIRDNIEEINDDLVQLEMVLKECEVISGKMIQYQHDIESRAVELNHTSTVLKAALNDIKIKQLENREAMKKEIGDLKDSSESRSLELGNARKLLDDRKKVKTESEQKLHAAQKDSQNWISKLNLHKENWSALVNQREEKMQELESKQVMIRTLQNELAQLDQEIFLLQNEAIKDQPYNLVDTVEFLSFETEMIRSTLVEMKETTHTINQQISLANAGPELKSILAQIENNLQRKETLLKQIEIENGKLISYDNPINTLSNTLETKLTQQNILGENIQVYKRTIHELHQELLGLNSKIQSSDISQLTEKIDNNFSYLEDRNNKLVRTLKINADLDQQIRENAQELQHVMNEKAIEMETRKQHALSKEKQSRIEKLRKEKILLHKDHLSSLEKDLMNEDSRFKEILLLAEQRLSRKKEILVKELEALVNRQKHVSLQNPQRDLSTEMQCETNTGFEHRVPDFDFGSTVENVGFQEKIEPSPKRSLPVKSIQTEIPQKIKTTNKEHISKRESKPLPAVEPSSLVKRRLGSLSLQNENKLNVSERFANENSQEQTSKKPRARMRSVLSTKNLNVEN